MEYITPKLATDQRIKSLNKIFKEVIYENMKHEDFAELNDKGEEIDSEGKVIERSKVEHTEDKLIPQS